jgi:UDP-N-acetylglucosamine diphosphorylase/glucosamine-1-phosphate N-acetyltransferase
VKRRLVTVILAAGKGTRMKSDLAKVLHPVCGRPMIHHVIRLARSLGSERTIAVIGHQKEKVREALKDEPVEFAVQEPQLGTGHAVMQTEDLLHGYDGEVLILSGDVPLLTLETMTRFIDFHFRHGSAGSVLTTLMPDATGYGRVIRTPEGDVSKIVEHKDATEGEQRIREINSGIYVFRAKDLFLALNRIDANNAQNEYYLPDVLKVLIEGGKSVGAFVTQDYREIAGINTVDQLQEAETMLSARLAASEHRP